MGLLTGIDYCAGSAIGSLVFERIGLSDTVCYIEYDKYCQRLIEQRIKDGWINDAPIWDDARTFDGTEWKGRADFIFGGIPCQGYSTAGTRKGANDVRDLWPDFKRVVSEVRPRVVCLENVSGFVNHRDGLRRILGGFCEIGYDAEWEIIPSCAFNSPHSRKRVFVVAYPTGRRFKRSIWKRQEITVHKPDERSTSCFRDYWGTEPKICGVVTSHPGRVDQVRIVGNSWNVAVAEYVGCRIKKAVERGLI